MEINNFIALERLTKPYKFIALCDLEGNQLVNFNNGITPKAKRLEQIKTRLTSEALIDGKYIIKCKDSVKGQKCDEIIFLKGEIKSEDIQPKKTEKLSEDNTSVLTFAKAIEMNKQIAELTYENKSLKSELEITKESLSDAEAEIVALEAELNEAKTEKPIAAEGTLSEQQPQSLLNGFGSILKELLPTITGMLDTHYSLKDRQLKILESKNNYQIPIQPEAQNFEVPENTFILDEQEQNIVTYFEALKTNNPEMYAKALEGMQNEMTGGADA